MGKVKDFFENKVRAYLKDFYHKLTIQPISRIENVYLKIRFMYFKKYIKQKNFSDKKVVFESDFSSLDQFHIKNNEFYNNNDCWFSKDAVSLVPDGVSIKCYKDPSEHTSWQGTRTTNWTSGMIETRTKFNQPNGVWEVDAKICDSWIAIWLLKRARDISGHGEGYRSIIPEIDIMEIIKHKVKQTVHYGYTNKEYRKLAIGSSLFKNDDKFHKFTVECLSNGYNFYIDNYLTTKFRSRDTEFVSSVPQYILINNANSSSKNGDSDKNPQIDTDFIIRKVKVYE